MTSHANPATGRDGAAPPAGHSVPAVHRVDGWTPDRQRQFLEALAEGHSVIDACRLVGLSHQSAYAFRRRAAGAAFALGWSAARIVAREKLADTLLVRAIEGQVETVTRADGTSIERHRYDNRLAVQLLGRLDRLAQRLEDDPAGTAVYHISQSFDAFLDMLPDQAGADGEEGLWYPQLPQLRAVGEPVSADFEDAEDEDEEDEDAFPHEKDRVWYSADLDDWLTDFPPPDDFDGEEMGEFGDTYYSRPLSPSERRIVEAADAVRREASRIEHAAERDLWFAAEAREGRAAN